ncbi:MAG: hypothetical protein H6945_08885 [Zoogloeaceae bacterium]|nr:hypothetical protein [Rhodocyclaceae bacterium]MCP5235837.1 hypothetical protein [Zoogloeaceae bacterium]
MSALRLSMSCVVLAIGLCLPALSPAAVYKCFENGRLVYSDRKCAAESKPMDSAPALDNQRRGVERRSGYERSSASETRSGRRRPAGTTVIDQADPAKKALCEEVRGRKARAERNGGNYRGASVQELESLEFSHCYGHVNGAP